MSRILPVQQRRRPRIRLRRRAKSEADALKEFQRNLNIFDESYYLECEARRPYTRSLRRASLFVDAAQHRNRDEAAEDEVFDRGHSPIIQRHPQAVANSPIIQRRPRNDYRDIVRALKFIHDRVENRTERLRQDDSFHFLSFPGAIRFQDFEGISAGIPLSRSAGLFLLGPGDLTRSEVNRNTFSFLILTGTVHFDIQTDPSTNIRATALCFLSINRGVHFECQNLQEDDAVFFFSHEG